MRKTEFKRMIKFLEEDSVHRMVLLGVDKNIAKKLSMKRRAFFIKLPTIIGNKYIVLAGNKIHHQYLKYKKYERNFGAVGNESWGSD